MRWDLLNSIKYIVVRRRFLLNRPEVSSDLCYSFDSRGVDNWELYSDRVEPTKMNYDEACEVKKGIDVWCKDRVDIVRV